ncbi:MAG: hypothetical protein WDA10_11970 [Porticoccaceae bacterium]|jgi:hypothetical protein|nr:hypothetical protein [Porticoccaceae bacterium]
MKLATLFVAISLPVFAGQTLAQGEGTDTAALFASLQADKRTAEQIIVELVNSGLELDAATAYTVANADSIGLAVAYAHAGVCLAEEPTFAEAVAKKAVEGATEQSRNAVQARVTETLANFDSGGCDLLVDERNNASQAFAEGGDAGADGGAAGGGAVPPPVEDDDDDISLSQ